MHLFISVLFIPFLIYAAPLPTTGSSTVNSPQWNTAFSQMGFTFKLVSKEWVYLENPSPHRSSVHQQIDLGLKTLSESARLSLKTENYKGKVNLEAYAKKYLRDYNQYGFEVLSKKFTKINGSAAVVIDLIQKNKATQSRQFFLAAHEKITVASCIEKLELFSLSAPMCDQLMNTYNWRAKIEPMSSNTTQ